MGDVGIKPNRMGICPLNQSLWGALNFKIWGPINKSKQIGRRCLLHMNVGETIIGENGTGDY